jgi:hypothetical protein
MSYRKTEKPTVTERPRAGGGVERVIKHPSFATCRVSRVSGHANLFDSNIAHDGYITMTFSEAEKHEDPYSEHVYGHNRMFLEVAMTENQFVALVTRMNVGSGVPVTIQHRQTGPLEVTPAIGTFEDSAERLGRMADEIDEGVRLQMKERLSKLKGLLEGLPKKKAAEIESLIDLIVNQSMSNMDFGRSQITEHAEKLVTKAKVEISAHVTGLCTQLGVDSLRQLTQAAASVRVAGDNLLQSDS